MGPIGLLNAPHMEIRELRNSLSAVVGRKQITVVTERGRPAEVLLPYNTVLSLLVLLEDLGDRRMTEIIRKGHKSLGKGAKGLPTRPGLEKFLKK